MSRVFFKNIFNEFSRHFSQKLKDEFLEISYMFMCGDRMSNNIMFVMSHSVCLDLFIAPIMTRAHCAVQISCNV